MSPKPANLPVLTRAESEVMQALWNLGEGTVQQILERLGKDLAYTTILTLVRILEQKGYVAHGPHPSGGKAHLFRPAVEPGKARRLHARDLIDRLFGGSTETLVNGLLEDEALTRDELEALRERIDERLGGPKKGKKK
ncbi:MAG TPA: BlaI/MecI/CopY family transcriptional regulator [Myxococcales bacterium]